MTSLAKHEADPAAPHQLCVAQRSEQGGFIDGFTLLWRDFSAGTRSSGEQRSKCIQTHSIQDVNT